MSYKLESSKNEKHEYETLISRAEQLRAEGQVDDAIAECSTAVEYAVKNSLFKKEMQARNLSIENTQVSLREGHRPIEISMDYWNKQTDSPSSPPTAQFHYVDCARLRRW